MRRELAERRDTELPPFSKSVSIDISEGEAQSLIRGLEAARGDGRLPNETRILGPIKIKGDLQRILLLAPHEKADSLVSLLHEYQRRRSTAKKSLLVMRIDPYSLTK
jgi:primosomal protein N' (replication factor Y)